MSILNIGPLEFILLLVIMFILLGPEGMVRTARQIGSWIRVVVRSPMWREILGYSQEIRELPTKIVRETGLEEDLKEIRQAATDATSEAQKSIQEANQQINESLKETGSVNISIDTASGSTIPSGTPVETASTNTVVNPPKPPTLID
jgi:Sec-independent protein translocase protein TatA